MVKFLLTCYFVFAGLAFSQSYQDQFFTHTEEGLIGEIESLDGIEISSDGKKILLAEGKNSGSAIFKEELSQYPFNRGLPSWNGHAEGNKSSFRVLMRFYVDDWSPWLTVGYWKDNIWSSYGSTRYEGGKIDYDYVVLNSFCSRWQFKVEMKRTGPDEPSPSLHKLSFSVSDQRTTDNVDIEALAEDKPEKIFIPTEHFYQYGIDQDFGGDICSPTSVSMVLRSFEIEVDPRQFAIDNYDPYWKIYGMWPRAVQNAAEYNLNGAVTRYRSWNEAYDVLANNGRIVMTVGPPLYSGHLMMLAGFDEYGNPLVHDPAKSNGYGYRFNKKALTESWFSKGGISYTFFFEDSANIVSAQDFKDQTLTVNDRLGIYPNPFNPQTNIVFRTNSAGYTEIIIYDIMGREVKTLHKDYLEKGTHTFLWNASGFSSGLYFVRVVSEDYNKTIKAFLLK